MPIWTESLTAASQSLMAALELALDAPTHILWSWNLSLCRRSERWEYSMRLVVTVLVLLLSSPSVGMSQGLTQNRWQWPQEEEAVEVWSLDDAGSWTVAPSVAAEDSVGTSRIVIWGLAGLAVGGGIGLATVPGACETEACALAAPVRVALAAMAGAAIGVVLAVWRNRHVDGRERSGAARGYSLPP